MALPLMPKATAVWLVENTTLTFEQIAEFCGVHPLEVQAIADGEVAIGIVGLDPVASNIWQSANSCASPSNLKMFPTTLGTHLRIPPDSKLLSLLTISLRMQGRTQSIHEKWRADRCRPSTCNGPTGRFRSLA